MAVPIRIFGMFFFKRSVIAEVSNSEADCKGYEVVSEIGV